MQNQLSEKQELESLYEGSLSHLERGEIIKGKIMTIRNDGVVVDVGYKFEGIIPLKEFSEKELENIKESDEIEVFIEKIDDAQGVISLSKDRALKIKGWETLIDAYEKGTPVEVQVTSKTKGGVLTSFYGINGFIPASLLELRKPRNLDEYVGKTLKVKIEKIEPPKNLYGQWKNLKTSLIFSRKAYLDEERENLKKELSEKIQEGLKIKGTVKNITNYGVFVDLGGLDGFLHISDISWGKIKHPSQVFEIGKEYEFIILKVDPENERITLGYKQKKSDPWESIDKKYHPGMKVRGKVTRIEDFGLFVELEEGVEGLVHISELDWTVSKHPSYYAEIDDWINVKILDIDKEHKKISLSLKQLKPKPWEVVAKKYKVGDRITGKVKTITDFGVFVRLPEGVDGLIHISDISWTKHIEHPSQLFKKGQKVDAVILNLEPEKEKLSLGIKQLSEDPWLKEIPEKFKVGEVYNARVIRKTEHGLFVDLEGIAEGLVYNSEIEKNVPVKEGDEIKVIVVKVDPEKRKIGLSMKKIDENEE
ncbi:MAG TPA: 30S ribosomal protein S1 [Thermodesulfovibrio thiophilus]|nr:30S ribosomal protein S1 [Thermodesulfovibrio thiophilus]HQA03495.1 30S ribosomal protein S1 [Thermodesulfovibrio thiophilus]HQD36080.1 30S ribosomal protein S1 [Thermodesulfovibrio thiophilus]